MRHLYTIGLKANTLLPNPLPEKLPHPDHNIRRNLKSNFKLTEYGIKKWIWEQYDSLVMGESWATAGINDTQAGRASDAAVVRVPDSSKALAISSDCNPYVIALPIHFEGGKQAVAEILPQPLCKWRKAIGCNQ